MQTYSRVLMVVVLSLFATGLPVHADILYLKNGRQITGTIVKDTNETIIMEVGAGNVMIDRADIVYLERGATEDIEDLRRQLLTIIEADRLAEDKNWDQAAQKYRAGLVDNPNNPDILYGLAVASLSLGQPHAAARNLSVVLQHDPTHPEAARSMGQALQQINHPDQALGAYKQTLSQRPDDIEVLTNTAVLYYQRGDFAAACDMWEQIDALDPGRADIQNNLACAYAQMDRWDEAMSTLQETVTADDTAPIALRNLAEISWYRGEHALARQHFQRWLEAHPEDASAWERLIVASWRLGDLASVERAATQFSVEHAETANAWHFLGLAIRRNNSAHRYLSRSGP